MVQARLDNETQEALERLRRHRLEPPRCFAKGIHLVAQES